LGLLPYFSIFAALVLLYHLRIRVVRADAAYFNYAFLNFIRNVLHASANVDQEATEKAPP